MVLSTDFMYLLIIVVILEILRFRCLATIGIVLISTDKKTKIVIFILDFFLLFELNQNKKYFLLCHLDGVYHSQFVFLFFFFFFYKCISSDEGAYLWEDWIRVALTAKC